MLDNFSKQAGAYARFRPSYPPELLRCLAGLAPEQKAAWDCGTGNGQVAAALAKHFEAVLATDISSRQLKEAMPHPRIRYSKEQAEHCSERDQTFDLIIVAQAIHWFDFDRFYAEVRRVSRPGGILAVIGYNLFHTTDTKVNAIIQSFYKNVTGPYWDPERRYIDDGYQTIPFPFDELGLPDFKMEFEWSVEDMLGYFRTWSAVQHYQEKNEEDPVLLIEPALRKAWAGVGERTVCFPLLKRIGRLPQ